MEEAYLPVIEPSSHAANLLQLKNGDLLCFWFAGSWEGKSGVAIVVSRLLSGSTEWSKPVVIDRRDGASFQNPVPFEAPDGTIWLIHTTQPAGEGQKNARVLVVKSRDQGRTWTSPQMLFDVPGAFVRDPIVVRADGDWLLPMYFTPSEGITTDAETNYSVVKISTDRGRTWSECAIPNSNGLVQPSVVEVKSKFVAFLRSRYADFIYRSTSADGCHWTAAKATSLPNNNASIQAVKLKDGRIAIAFNNARAAAPNGRPATGPRKPVTVALSADGGDTWSAMRNIQLGKPEKSGDPSYGQPMKKAPGRDEYSYPSILQAHDGSIFVAYTFRRETIKVVRFSETWIEDASVPKR
jgi:predicted neuraminidase